MPTKKPKLGTYVNEITAKKFTKIAEANYRTVSKHLEFLVQQEIQKYESEKGEIKIEEPY